MFNTVHGKNGHLVAKIVDRTNRMLQRIGFAFVLFTVFSVDRTFLLHIRFVVVLKLIRFQNDNEFVQSSRKVQKEYPIGFSQQCNSCREISGQEIATQPPHVLDELERRLYLCIWMPDIGYCLCRHFSPHESVRMLTVV